MNNLVPRFFATKINNVAASGLVHMVKKGHKYVTIWPNNDFFFWFEGVLGSATGAEFPVSLSNHVGFTPRLLFRAG